MRVLRVAMASTGLLLVGIMGLVEGQEPFRQIQRELEARYRRRLVDVKQEVPYVKEAVVIDRAGRITVRPVEPKDRAEERYAWPGRKHEIWAVKVQPERVIFKIAPAYLDPRILPTPPINPEAPPWDPEDPPPSPKPHPVPSPIPLKRGPVHFELILEYASLDELTPARIEARWEPILRVIPNK